jgi:Amt family ammonium transporter
LFTGSDETLHDTAAPLLFNKLSTTQQLRAGIDDPLDSGAVHFGNGLLGMLALAFFAKPSHVATLTGSPCGGVFYTRKGWLQLGMQTLAVVIVSAVSVSVAAALFGTLRRLRMLRVELSTELAGLDNVEHGGPAYEWHGGGGANGGALHPDPATQP